MRQIQKYIPPALILIFISLSPVWAEQFEGIISASVIQKGKRAYIDLYIKMKKVKAVFKNMQDNADGFSELVLDGDKRKAFIISHTQNLYYELPARMIKNIKGADKGAQGEFGKTTETKTILDHNCMKWTAASNGKKMEIWTANDIVFDDLFYNILKKIASKKSQLTSKAMDEICDEHYFPVEIYDVSGNEKAIVWQVTGILNKSLEKAVFEVPVGYERTTKTVQAPLAP